MTDDARARLIEDALEVAKRLKKLSADMSERDLDMKLPIPSIDPDKGADMITRLADALSTAEARNEDAIRAGENATLPDGFQWGDDAMEAFEFGKERATTAARPSLESSRG